VRTWRFRSWLNRLRKKTSNYVQEKEKKETTLCRWALHRDRRGRWLLFLIGKEVTTHNLQDEGGGKEKQAHEYVALQS